MRELVQSISERNEDEIINQITNTGYHTISVDYDTDDSDCYSTRYLDLPKCRVKVFVRLSNKTLSIKYTKLNNMTIQIKDLNAKGFQEIPVDDIRGGYTHSPTYYGTSSAIQVDSWSQVFSPSNAFNSTRSATSGGWW